MSVIFSFFLRVIELHVGAFRAAQSESQPTQAAHSRVVQVALLTLTGFVEWVSIEHIRESDGRLLQILCVLLNDHQFQLPAAECLSQICNRKGQIKDRKPILLLFSEEYIEYVVRAANDSNGGTAEQNYTFLKKFIQVLAGLASQVTSLCGKEDIISPVQLRKFLETLFILTRHPSLIITQDASAIWVSLLKHEHLSKEAVFLEFIPKLIEVVGPKVIKVSSFCRIPISLLYCIHECVHRFHIQPHDPSR